MDASGIRRGRQVREAAASLSITAGRAAAASPRRIRLRPACSLRPDVSRARPPRPRRRLKPSRGRGKQPMRTRISIANRQKSLRPDRELLRRTLFAILSDHPEERLCELSLALVDDREMHRVHREFLGEDSPTDVMSFRYDGEATPPAEGAGMGPSGELVISAETALREARA